MRKKDSRPGLYAMQVAPRATIGVARNRRYCFPWIRAEVENIETLPGIRRRPSLCSRSTHKYRNIEAGPSKSAWPAEFSPTLMDQCSLSLGWSFWLVTRPKISFMNKTAPSFFVVTRRRQHERKEHATASTCTCSFSLISSRDLAFPQDHRKSHGRLPHP